MAAALSLRQDFTAGDLRLQARRTHAAGQARRLLALACIDEGGSRSEAARIGGVTLQVLKVTGLGFSLPRETVQPALDAFTQTLTANLPMGIHADKIEVTETGGAARFITRDATIPNGQQDPCFAGL